MIFGLPYQKLLALSLMGNKFNFKWRFRIWRKVTRACLFLREAKVILDELEATDKPLSSEEFYANIFRLLGPEYHLVVAALRTRTTVVSFKWALRETMVPILTLLREPTMGTLILITYKGKGKGIYNNNGKLQCQIYDYNNLGALTCGQRFDRSYDGPKANIAQTHTSLSTTSC